MPSSCHAMREMMKIGDVILYAPPRGSRATLKIRLLYVRRGSPTLYWREPHFIYSSSPSNSLNFFIASSSVILLTTLTFGLSVCCS